MLSINKTYCWIFVLSFALLVLSIHLLKFLDELMVLIMMLLVMLDVLVNRNFKRYKLLWVITGIMIFYSLYSIFFMSYNTKIAVLYDFIAQMKPFCYFCVAYAVTPKLDNNQKQVLKFISVFNGILVFILFVTGLYKLVFMHIAHVGLVSVVSFMFYFIASIDENGNLKRKDVIISVLILTVGLTCTRSKFYGVYILALYMLFLYRPGLFKKIKFTHVLMFISIIALVLFAAWTKIDFYFVSGGGDYQMFGEEMMQSFARPVLYASMFVLLGMHPIFGSGLASFATNASSTAVNYSGAYYELGIDTVYGLSPTYDAFICDAFYPELAQFGIVGILLFISFFVWLYRRLGLCLYMVGKVQYTIGVVSIIAILIECIASTSFNQGFGGLCMMILGYLVSQFKNISKTELQEIRERGYKDKKALDYIK